MYIILADFIIVVHFLFILFVVFGGLLVLRRKSWAWFHLPAVLWAAFIEFAGWTCPLTPLENAFREQGGSLSYEPGFIEHYLLPIIYPAELTRELQVLLGIAVLAINVVLYLWVRCRVTKTGR